MVEITIFHAYDIRGKYPQELNEKTAYNIGRAFGTLYSGKIVVGGDARLSTPSIKENLIKGLTESGINVVDIGEVPTASVYFSCYNMNYDGGIMITGSHIPKEYNGMKFCEANGIPIGYDNGLNKIEELIETEEFKEGKGEVIKKNFEREYLSLLKTLFSLNLDGVKVVVDGANGSSGKLHSQILREFGAEVVELYCDPDGNFPNHSPDPTANGSLVDLNAKVVETKADIGLAFDGDGDRLVVVNEKGEIVDSNHVFSLIIEEVLKKEKGKIVHDVLCSKLIDDVTIENGGTSITWKVGHTLIARKCAEENAIIAGEVSGHYFFKEASYTDDVLIACIKILNILNKSDKNLSGLIKKYPYFYTYSDRINIDSTKKVQFIEELKGKLKSQGHDLITLDGVRVNFDNGWMLFRLSNTEPKISMGYESSDKKEFEKIQKIANEIIKTIPSD